MTCQLVLWHGKGVNLPYLFYLWDSKCFDGCDDFAVKDISTASREWLSIAKEYSPSEFIIVCNGHIALHGCFDEQGEFCEK